MSMDNQLHPNWQALGSSYFKWKTFVPAKSSIPRTDYNVKRKLNTSINGEETKHFYESLFDNSNNEHFLSSRQSSDDLECINNVNNGSSETRINNINVNNEKSLETNSRIINQAMKYSQNNDYKSLQSLLQNGLNVNIKDEYGWSLLMVASCAGAADVVCLLLKHKARVGHRDSKGNTALYLATMKGHNKIVEMLIKSNKRRYNKQREPVELSNKEFYCDVCCKTFKECTEKEHKTSITHQLNLKPKLPGTVYGIPRSNKGFQLLVNQGWDTEKGLGNDGKGQKFPVKTILKTDRKGFGDNKKSAAKVTHFGPGDVSAIKRNINDKRVPQQRTISRQQANKQRDKDKRKESDLRRLLNEPDY